MVRVKFEYRDRFIPGEYKWRQQTCEVSSVEECIRIYGLGVDCEYEILEVEEI